MSPFPITCTTGDDERAAKLLHDRDFLRELEGAEIITRGAAEADAVFLKQCGKLVVTDGVELFALRAVFFRPELDGRRTAFFDLGQDFRQRKAAIHGGGEQVIQLPRRVGGESRRSSGSGDGLEEMTAVHALD